MQTDVKKLSLPALFGLLLTAMPLLFSSLVSYVAITHEPTIARFGLLEWSVVTLLCCLTCTAAITTPTLLALLFGYFLGWWAMLPMLVINMLAIFLVNFIVYRLNHEQVLHWLERNPKVGPLLSRIRQDELKVIFFCKLSPALPFVITNIVFALSGARLQNILLGGFLGMVPRTLLAVWSGSQARQIRQLLNDPNANSDSQIAVGLLVLVSVVGLFWVLGRTVKA